MEPPSVVAAEIYRRAQLHVESDQTLDNAYDFAWLILRIVDKCESAANKSDWCVICENHPSHGHGKYCPLFVAQSDD